MKNDLPTIAENRRARFDYEVLETFDAGIELRGFEVKSAKTGHMQLAGGYVIVRGIELWLVNSHIPPYQPKNAPPDYKPDRNRRLLMHTEEIKRLAGLIKEKKSSLIPLRAYVKNNLIKIELGLARPRKKSDKREFIKKRSHEREMRETD
ncbi:MAG: SsrA-binding protein [Candidatus Liptonbacteria bacterium RIFCSPLOWO2_01_FULL_52_25]|uniref:SsrA-binding protein n=1 Tax=Candidatus Liptonbacteria bacterium RIFCSPLOWO2_01_FULL_52_25 TaxID=1798650 RepID=A0A1G2CF39_9BACT|nr:MAG: SsrA-binding protein [Candidatus Liptonbacteria bacterium RIFCSPLOWO2_01_FULL_52_25]